MNQSRRETDETSAELLEIRKDNERIREDSHVELEKASLFRVLFSIVQVSVFVYNSCNLLPNYCQYRTYNSPVLLLKH